MVMVVLVFAELVVLSMLVVVFCDGCGVGVGVSVWGGMLLPAQSFAFGDQYALTDEDSSSEETPRVPYQSPGIRYG